MPKRRLHLELLLGHQVLDIDGRPAGRIEELIARRDGDQCYIHAYVLGRAGLAERMSVAGLSSLLVGFLGARRHAPAGHRVPWNRMDLSDPERPRLTCTLAELGAMQPRKNA
jgi:hypothetical protein